MPDRAITWDVFISYASEDKKAVARPIAEALRNEGLRVWFDDFTMSIGDSLNRSINEGLSRSRYAVVILSQSYFSKEWPQKELDGLVSREIQSGKLILPVWFNISRDEIAQYSPMLADRVAVQFEVGIDEVTRELMAVLSDKGQPKRQDFDLGEEERRHIEALLANGELERALHVIADIRPLRNNALILLSRLNTLQKLTRIGHLSSEAWTSKSINITEDILRFLDRSQKDFFALNRKLH